jgi:hypothetical protein
MKTSFKNYPRLSKESALFIVSGIKVAYLYHLHNGSLKLVKSVLQPAIGLDRRKGRFEHRAGGQAMGSGEVMSSYTKEERSRFLGAVNKAAGKINFRYDCVFLFAPTRISASLQAALPKKVQTKITRRFLGNYSKQHGTKLLAMIKERRMQIKKRNRDIAVPIKKEALLLLKRKYKK